MKTHLSNSTTTPEQTGELSTQDSTLKTVEPPQALDFVQLSPIGIFPHVRGYQNVDRTALETMVKNFKSFFGRLGRRFAGIPFYIGHPDVPGYENVFTDRKAYGWIMELEVRDDGLYGRTQWSAAGRDLIANRHYKFLSPFWEAIRIGTKEGRSVLSPTVLKSVGLTNEPNLPVLPLANSECPDEDRTCIGTTLALFETINPGGTPPAQRAEKFEDSGGMSSTSPTFAAPSPAPFAPSTSNFEPRTSNFASSPILAAPSSEPLQKEGLQNHADPNKFGLRDVVPPIENAVPPPRSSASPAVNVPNSFDTRHSDLENRIALLNQRLIQVLLDNAVAQARILPIERPHWERALSDNFEDTAVTLANAAPKLNLASKTESLRPIHLAESSEAKQKRILRLVNERMRSSGATYHEAWLSVRSEQSHLFT
ncbi:MAG TPA: phage protease [Verrucomicrobiae bacterium]